MRAGAGTAHLGVGQCKHHGGSTESGNKHAAKQMAVVMGAEVDIEPHEALMLCVRIAAGEVAYCTRKIAELTHEEATGHPVTRTVSEFTGDDGQVYETEQTKHAPIELNIWIRVRQEALDRLAKFAKMALDAGVEERKVRMAEQWGERLARLLAGILEDLNLTPKQKKIAPDVIQGHLLSMERTAGLLEA